MYNYVSSLAKRRGNGGFWDDRNLGQVTFEEITKTYSWVVFTLDNPHLGGLVYSTLEDMKGLGLRPEMTVSQWFSHIGNRYFEVTYEPYELKTDTIRYRDAIRAGYSWTHIAANVAPEINLPLSDRPDLNMTKQGVNIEDLCNYGLFTVNGYAHRVQYNNNRAVVLDGGRTIMKADRNSIGLMNFQDVGELTYIPINLPMISGAVDANDLFDAAYIDLGVDLTNKSVIMSIGGYLHFADSACKVINKEDGIVSVDFSKINLLERLFDSRDVISLSSLPLGTTQLNEGAITTSDLKNDDVLRAYLTLPQSFAVVVDAPMLYRRQVPLQHSGLDNVYYAYEDVTLPVQAHHGLFPETWVRQEDDMYVVTIHSALRPNRILYTGPWRDDARVDPSVAPGDMFSVSDALLTEIGTQSIVYPT